MLASSVINRLREGVKRFGDFEVIPVSETESYSIKDIHVIPLIGRFIFMDIKKKPKKKRKE